MSHFDRTQLEEVMEGFKLKKLEEGEYELSEDCILLRGSCVILKQDEKSAETGEKAQPLTFFHEHENQHVKLLERTSFLVGKFPTPSLEGNRYTLSIGSATTRKKAVPVKRTFEMALKK
jgi:hypothetical protein